MKYVHFRTWDTVHFHKSGHKILLQIDLSWLLSNETPEDQGDQQRPKRPGETTGDQVILNSHPKVLEYQQRPLKTGDQQRPKKPGETHADQQTTGDQGRPLETKGDQTLRPTETRGDQWRSGEISRDLWRLRETSTDP